MDNPTSFGELPTEVVTVLLPLTIYHLITLTGWGRFIHETYKEFVQLNTGLPVSNFYCLGTGLEDELDRISRIATGPVCQLATRPGRWYRRES